MAELTETDIREQVRERYAGHAKLAIDISPGAAREAEEPAAARPVSPAMGRCALRRRLQRGRQRSRGRGVGGCGVPTAVADLHEGETVQRSPRNLNASATWGGPPREHASCGEPAG
jgi:arsenite methyltransferase